MQYYTIMDEDYNYYGKEEYRNKKEAIKDAKAFSNEKGITLWIFRNDTYEEEIIEPKEDKESKRKELMNAIEDVNRLLEELEYELAQRG